MTRRGDGGDQTSPVTLGIDAQGRLLVSSYVPVEDRSRHADRLLRRLGFRVDGVTDPAQLHGRAHPPSAWIQRP